MWDFEDLREQEHGRDGDSKTREDCSDTASAPGGYVEEEEEEKHTEPPRADPAAALAAAATRVLCAPDYDPERRLRIAFVDFWPGFMDETDRWVSVSWFRKNLVNVDIVEYTNDPDVIMYSVFGEMHQFLKRSKICKLVFYTGENIPAPVLDGSLCLSFEHMAPARGVYQWRLPIWVLNECVHDLLRIHEERLQGKYDRTVHKRKGFCSFVASNLKGRRASVRAEFVQMLSKRYKPVSCGGHVFNNVGGPVEDKTAFQKGYRFDVSFENESSAGYCTEKVLHAFVAGCVPIYWGDPYVAKLYAQGQFTGAFGVKAKGTVPDFNPDALISAHDFKSFEELADHVARVDKDPKLLERYLKQPILSDKWYNELKSWPKFCDRLTRRIFHDHEKFKGGEPTDMNGWGEEEPVPWS